LKGGKTPSISPRLQRGEIEGEVSSKPLFPGLTRLAAKREPGDSQKHRLYRQALIRYLNRDS